MNIEEFENRLAEKLKVKTTELKRININVILRPAFEIFCEELEKIK